MPAQRNCRLSVLMPSGSPLSGGADAVRQLLAGFVARWVAEYGQPEGRTRRADSQSKRSVTALLSAPVDCLFWLVRAKSFSIGLEAIAQDL
jgi:hypothetical protein